MSIFDRKLQDTSFLVLDLETTGLDPKRDRIIEIAAYVIDGGAQPKKVLDSLVHPEGAVISKDVETSSGLSAENLAEAPTFKDLAGVVAAALADRIIVSHNAWFELAFLEEELARAGYRLNKMGGGEHVPHLCTMRLGAWIYDDKRNLALYEACDLASVQIKGRHTAAADALAAAELLHIYLRKLRRSGVETFKDLAEKDEKARFLDSFLFDPVPAPYEAPSATMLRPRAHREESPDPTPQVRYREAVLNAVADGLIEAHELEHVRGVRDSLGLTDPQVRAVHGAIFGAMMSRFTEDNILDLGETNHLQQLHSALSELGWAPGEPAR